MSDSDCGSRGLAAEIGLQIPGFKGYLRREYRRDADRVQREFLAKKIKGAKDTLEAVKRDLAMKGALDGLTRLEAATDKVSRVISRVANADSGYTGFFAERPIGEAELDLVYQADLALIAESDGVIQAATGVTSDAGDEDRNAALTKFETELARFDGQFDKRAAILKGAI